MPPVIAGAAVAGTIAGAGAVIAGTAPFWVAFGTTFFTTLVVGGISHALTDKPHVVPFSALAARGGQTVSVRAAADSVKVIYGETRVGGTIAHIETTGDDDIFVNQFEGTFYSILRCSYTRHWERTASPAVFSSNPRPTV